MENRVPRSGYPLWVKLSLWGVPGRRGLWAFVIVSLACGVAALVYGLRDPRYFPAAIIGVAAVPYWLAIRWVDRHGTWESET
jgi:hypothetical protein